VANRLVGQQVCHAVEAVHLIGRRPAQERALLGAQRAVTHKSHVTRPQVDHRAVGQLERGEWLQGGLMIEERVRRVEVEVGHVRIPKDDRPPEDMRQVSGREKRDGRQLEEPRGEVL
jgi:hypothetical protein